MASIRDYLPAASLDIARSAREIIWPSRRKAAGARHGTIDELALRVSPDGLVLAGPFTGLVLPVVGSWGGYSARLSGAYEEEIADRIEEMIERRPGLIIDIGAAEGYYAVGFALRLPHSQVIAYEIDSNARRECAETMRINGVSNVRIRGRITPRELRRNLRPRALVLCDVEGYERELLDPRAAPTLRLVYLIIELHEFANHGVTSEILARFADSHAIDLIDARPRVSRPPQLAHLDEQDALRAVEEGRPQDPPMQWAVMSPFL